jgi:hypothetical protein
MKYEYKCIDIKETKDLPSKVLNKLGKEGWRLICIRADRIIYLERIIK